MSHYDIFTPRSPTYSFFFIHKMCKWTEFCCLRHFYALDVSRSFSRAEERPSIKSPVFFVVVEEGDCGGRRAEICGWIPIPSFVRGRAFVDLAIWRMRLPDPHNSKVEHNSPSSDGTTIKREEESLYWRSLFLILLSVTHSPSPPVQNPPNCALSPSSSKGIICNTISILFLRSCGYWVLREKSGDLWGVR